MLAYVALSISILSLIGCGRCLACASFDKWTKIDVLYFGLAINGAAWMEVFYLRIFYHLN